MLKQTVQYEDFDGNQATETLYFNVTQTQWAENMHLVDEFRAMASQIQGPTRDLTSKEVQQILELVKKLIKISYGVRSDDGKRHIKTDEIWEEFTQTAAYDAFLMSLFTDTAKCRAFMMGIMPKDAAEQVGKAMDEVEKTGQLPAEARPLDDLRPAYQREGREPTPNELTEMTQSELQEAYRWKSQQYGAEEAKKA